MISKTANFQTIGPMEFCLRKELAFGSGLHGQKKEEFQELLADWFDQEILSLVSNSNPETSVGQEKYTPFFKKIVKERSHAPSVGDTLSQTIEDSEPIEGVILAKSAEVFCKPRNEFLESQQLLAILAEADKVLLNSVQYQVTLEKLAQIALRSIADWCIVDVIREDESFDRAIVMHRSPDKADLAAELQKNYKPHHSARGIPSRVLRTGQSLLIPNVTDEHYAMTSRSPRHMEILKGLGSRSYMSIPLIARGKFLGVMTFVASDPAVQYDYVDLSFGEELCSRAALAIDNALILFNSERATRVREDMIAIVSHDIRNPLTAIRSASELLRRFPVANDAESLFMKIVESIDKSVYRIERLTSDLLDLSKLEAGHLKIKLKAERISTLFGEMLDMFLPIAARHSIVLVAEYSEDFTVVCARERIHQIVSNLVSNAIKFTPRGGKIKVKAEDENDKVKISVEDTGIGISEADVPHIFTRFWQGKSSQSAGVGLGLSIVKAMVDLHGGTVSVVSKKGEGSTFLFTLPKSLN